MNVCVLLLCIECDSVIGLTNPVIRGGNKKYFI